MNQNKHAVQMFIMIFIIWILVGYTAVNTVYCAPNKNIDENNVAPDTDSLIESQLDSIELENLKREFEKYKNENFGKIIGDTNFSELLADTAKGKFRISVENVINNILKYLFKEIYYNIGLLLKIVAVAIILAILHNLQSSFMGQNVGELAFFAAYIVMVSILVISFQSASKWGLDAINDLTDFMYASFPVLVTLLVTGGNLVSGGVVQPLVVAAVNIAVMFMKNIFIPLVIFSTIFSILNNISDKVQLSNLAGLMRKICTWGLGFILVIFINFIAIQSAVSGVADGVTGKSIKFALNSMPVIGKYLSDATDTVLSCTLLIKNAAGVVVLIGILGISIIPMLKILSLIILYRLTAVIVEPISDKRITNCIVEISNSLVYLLAISAAVAVMFMITVTVIIGAGNISTMVR